MGELDNNPTPPPPPQPDQWCRSGTWRSPRSRTSHGATAKAALASRLLRVVSQGKAETQNRRKIGAVANATNSTVRVVAGLAVFVDILEGLLPGTRFPCSPLPRSSKKKRKEVPLKQMWTRTPFFGGISLTPRPFFVVAHSKTLFGGRFAKGPPF